MASTQTSFTLSDAKHAASSCADALTKAWAFHLGNRPDLEQEHLDMAMDAYRSLGASMALLRAGAPKLPPLKSARALHADPAGEGLRQLTNADFTALQALGELCAAVSAPVDNNVLAFARAANQGAPEPPSAA